MTARELEATLLARCATVAGETAPSARNECEANVFELAASAVRSRFPSESAKLMQAGAQFFAANPNTRLSLSEVINNGWVLSLPRLRDMLNRQLSAR